MSLKCKKERCRQSLVRQSIVLLHVDVTFMARRPPRPRMVIVGTSMEAFWVEYPGLPQRLEQLGTIIDRMAAESLKKYGKRLDLAGCPKWR